jgi:hypothetical protein
MDWPFWDTLDSTERAERYELLRQTFIDVHDHLDSHGHASTPIYVEIWPRGSTRAPISTGRRPPSPTGWTG